MAHSKLLHYLFGPNIFGIFGAPSAEASYEENVAEAVGNRMLMFARGLRHFCTVVSPVLVAMAYNRGWYEPHTVMKLVQYVVIYYSVAISFRTLGRLCSEDYRKFSALLQEVSTSKEPSPAAEIALRKYDYEIFMAPNAFTAESREDKKFATFEVSEFADMGPLWNLVKDPLCAAVVHSFGRRMLYPGATSLFKTLFQSVLEQGRRRLVVEHSGRRIVIKTQDGNLIDTMFVDKRHKTTNGSKLVITCEGNAGFYEVGIANAPLEKGYSVLGWNHPGFAQSTGLPYPEQELNAIDSVLQLATKKLGFKESDIVMYGWSIGGFTASWAAANYNVSALVLDATFDDLLPLALSKMPKPVDFIVHYAVRNYLNLAISKQVAMYKGPLKLIRRTDDDIIVTNEFGTAAQRRASNRANQLLIDVLNSRHEGLLRNEKDTAIVKDWLDLNAMGRIGAGYGGNLNELKRLRIYSGLNGRERTQLIYYYCDTYFVDFDAGHNVPLPVDYFNVPS